MSKIKMTLLGSPKSRKVQFSDSCFKDENDFFSNCCQLHRSRRLSPKSINYCSKAEFQHDLHFDIIMIQWFSVTVLSPRKFFILKV